MGVQDKNSKVPLFDDSDFVEPSYPTRLAKPEDFDDFDDWILDYIEENICEEQITEESEEQCNNLSLIDEDEGELPSTFSETVSIDSSLEPQVYVAHYVSPKTENPMKGFFEYESVHRASSRQNRHDARIHMLEIFGKDAVSWVIDKVKLKPKKSVVCTDQMELDFREPKKPRRRKKSKKYW